jgi:hypothetical protein
LQCNWDWGFALNSKKILPSLTGRVPSVLRLHR